MKILPMLTAALFLGASTVALAVPPGSGNWGGGPGNSGPGDKNGKNEQGGGGQTPPGQDKLFDDGPQWLKGAVIAQGYDKDSPTDVNNGKGNDPGQSGKAPGHDRK